MTMDGLPKTTQEMTGWAWDRYETWFGELAGRGLTPANVDRFMADWSELHELCDEVGSRLCVAKDADTADKDAEARFVAFVENVQPKLQEAEQGLKSKLLAARLAPANFDLPLRRMQTEAQLYRDENLPLFVQQTKAATEYAKVVGSQTVQWDGREVTLSQLAPVGQETDRARREQAWKLGMERRLRDRQALNDLWARLLGLRLQIARNAGFGDYRSYRWLDMQRFDYTPDNCRTFHRAIEEVVVPAAARILERRRQKLGLACLRPWDTEVDALGRQPLKPFGKVDEFRAGVGRMLTMVAPKLGEYFETMVREELLDLENRKNKAPGGYCTGFDAARRPFIFMNAVGIHQDVMTLVHEAGHAVHCFESFVLPYFQQRAVNLEFAEVASMGMELLAAPYFEQSQGGFYTADEAKRALVDNLEKSVLFWPYMAVVDAFQHWVYENPTEAADAGNCDKTWAALYRRFMPVTDWTGLEAELETGWHRKLHIFEVPFYYVEYGLAQLGAMQVWANALRDRTAAVEAYRRSLRLGGTRSLPGLYGAAGAKFAFDAGTLKGIIGLVESRLG
jgi:oligoendopeptidase F